MCISGGIASLNMVKDGGPNFAEASAILFIISIAVFRFPIEDICFKEELFYYNYCLAIRIHTITLP